MGPPIIVGGDREELPKLISERVLQWGRRSSSAEIPARGADDHHPSASMGPPIIVGEMGLVKLLLLVVPAASMGPPIIVGGDSLSRSSTCPAGKGFNGAADHRRRR